MRRTHGAAHRRGDRRLEVRELPGVLHRREHGQAAVPPPMSAIATQTVLDVGVVAFADIAVNGDVGPAAGDQPLTAPDTDANSAGGPDVEETLSSAFSDIGGGNGGLAVFPPVKNAGQFTNFEAAVAAATALAVSSSAGTKIVAFLSDGVASAGSDVTDDVAAAALAGVRFETFAIGSGSSCTKTGTANQGSLDEIATATGGTCTEVADLTELPDIVPGVIQSRLTEVALSLDQNLNGASDSPFVALTNAEIAPDLPQIGPASVDWSHTFPGLAPGDYEVCARATGSDGGGTGTVIECSTFHVNAPPDCTGLVVSPNLLWPPNHKLRLVSVTGASDPEGDDLTTTVTGVTQDEPVNGLGDGDESPDAVLAPASNQVRLRAERSGIGDGRVYRIAVTVTDEFGLSCTGTVHVGVPHDQVHDRSTRHRRASTRCCPSRRPDSSDEREGSSRGALSFACEKLGDLRGRSRALPRPVGARGTPREIGRRERVARPRRIDGAGDDLGSGRARRDRA